MTKRKTLQDTAQHVFELSIEEAERAKKLEAELLKLREKMAEMQVANASALGFISRHHGNSSEGFAVRKLLMETSRRAA